MNKINENRKPFYNTTIPNDWEVETLKDCCYIKGEYGINAVAVKYSEELPRYIRITDIDDYGNYSAIKKASVNDKNSKNFILHDGDILFARTGATVGKTYLYKEDDGKLVFAGFLIRFRPNNEQLIAEHLKYYTDTKLYWDWVKTISMRSGQPGINASEYGSLKLPLPPLPEQCAIADCLATWDKTIAATQKLISQKELRRKWLMQNLLMGKKRLKNFSGEWKIEILKDILITAGKPFAPIKNELYQQIGIRSHTKGIFYKEKVTGEELGNKRVFEIEPDCFVVNIVFAWEHAIAKTTTNELGMIASHRFPMYKPKDDILTLDYLLYYFKSPRGKYLLGLASPGGAGRNKTLGKSEFMKLKIPVPSIREQIAIAQILQTADKEIELVQHKLDKLKEQKKGMMQQLLTGAKRLNINN
jgi:type I restriction enzyme, S subunit